MAELPEQVFLARVAAVERADADAGPLRDGGDGRVRVGDEDIPGRLQDGLVVAGRLRPAAGQAGLAGSAFSGWRAVPAVS